MALGGLVMSVNHAGAKGGRELSLAYNGAAVAEGEEWMQISPYGQYPTNNGELVQVFGKDEAGKMVAEFNSTLGQMGQMFRGVPVYMGHPAQMPDRFKDPRRIGKVMKLEARDDGLYGKVEWNSLGKENLKEGYLVFPSPGWMHPKPAPGSTKIFPVHLDHVGMVNDPNIETVRPWTNSKDTDTQPKQPDEQRAMKEKICALLGLDPATATDEEIFAKITAMKDGADKATKLNTDLAAEAAKTAELEAKKKEMEGALATANSKAAEQLKTNAGVVLDLAVNGGKITEAQRAEWEGKLIANGGAAFKAEAEKLDKLESSLNTKALEIGGVKVNVADAQSRQIALNTAVAEAQAKNTKLTYREAFDQVKRDPKYKGLFAAMNSKPRSD